MTVSVEQQDRIEEIRREVEALPYGRGVRAEIEHIGFGIRRIRVWTTLRSGESIKGFEKALESIEGVSGVGVVSVMRVE